MATSIAEQIAVVVATRLGLIKTSNGYENTTSGVKRPSRIHDDSPKDYQIVLTQGDIEPDPELSHPGNPPATAWKLPFTIAGIIRQSDTDLTASDTLKNQFWGDIVKALTDATAWHNWGGLAINSTIGPVEDAQQGDGSANGFQLTLNVVFRTDENDPFTARA